MNLKAIHLFLILLLSLFFTCCLGTIYEGFSGDKMDMKYTNSQNSNNSAGMQYNTPTGVDSYDKSQLDSNRIRHERRRRHPGQGLRRIDIPAGDEDLYILKSEIVPPVCPKCPTICPSTRTTPPPPCPACARCPEPAFDCKKVPNYNSNNDSYLPKPMLSDFSTFGT